MDTIGNALFSKLILQKQRLLTDDDQHVMVITSQFHCIRACNYFKRIYEQAVAIVGVPTLGDRNREINLANHALLGEANAYQSSFEFSNIDGNKGIAIGDDQTLFFQLFYRHNLYKNRPDLFRKYYALLN